jgi:hypothetical protein
MVHYLQLHKIKALLLYPTSFYLQMCLLWWERADFHWENMTAQVANASIQTFHPQLGEHRS